MGILFNMSRRFNQKIFLSLIVPWLLVWALPWTTWLDNLPWLRVGLAGLIFIAPGMAVSMLLLGNRLTLLSHVTSGLALSMFLVGSLGVLGRIAHVPFTFIKPIFFSAGLIVFLTLTFYSLSIKQSFKPKSYSPIPIVLLLLTIVLGSVIALTNRIESDGFSYLAYLTNFQYSPRLSFSEVIFGSGDLEPLRFWLAMFPMNQAFIAEVSNLHGILLFGYYLNPILVAVSLLAAYNLFEDLLKSDFLASIALFLQVAFLFLLLDTRQPGNLFFYRVTEDKTFAAFALAPVFFLAVTYCLESPTLRRGIFMLLCGWSLALTHPIILAYSVFIAGTYIVIITITHKNFKTLGILILLLMLVILPSASLRFPALYGVAVQAPFDLESALVEDPAMNPIGDRISYIEGTPFYGFNLDKIKIQIRDETPQSWLTFILSWSYLWILVLGFLWSLTKINQPSNAIPAFILSSSTLILLSAIPYTGWLVGYFVSARMLWRAPWLFPVGLVGSVLIMNMINMILPKKTIKARQVITARNATLVVALVICIILIVRSFSYQSQTRSFSRTELHDYRVMLEELAATGNYIETNIEQPSIFLASDETMNYLPGLSSKSKVVFFRSPLFTPHPVNRGDVRDVLSSNEYVPIKRRMKVLDRYDVQYLLIEDVSVQEYYAEFPQFFTWEKTGDYWLIEYRGSVEGQ
jgi:hypothetical protein